MRVLVTGAAGMVGAHVAAELLARGAQVIAIDDLSRGDAANVPSAATFIQADIRNAEMLSNIFAQNGPFDSVLHEASLINAGIDAENAVVDIAININGTLNLLRLSTESHVRRFVYASSVAIYGRPMDLPARESETIPRPIASYGIGKLAAEHYVRYFAEMSGDMSYACLRYSNIYGPLQHPLGEVGVVGVFVQRLFEGLPLIQHGDGTQCRDFLYVSDCVEATIAALMSSRNMVLNIGSGYPTSVKSIIDELKKVADSKIAVDQTIIRHGEIGRFWCDISLAQEMLGWTPSTLLGEGLRRTLEWRLNRRLC